MLLTQWLESLTGRLFSDRNRAGTRRSPGRGTALRSTVENHGVSALNNSSIEHLEERTLPSIVSFVESGDISNPGGPTFTVDTAGANTWSGTIGDSNTDTQDSFTVNLAPGMQIDHVKFEFTDNQSGNPATNWDASSPLLFAVVRPSGGSVNLTDTGFDVNPVLPSAFSSYLILIDSQFAVTVNSWKLTLTTSGSAPVSNSAPAGTDATVTTSEDTPYTFSTADFGFTDPSDSPTNNLLGIEITNIPAVGSLTNNGVSVAAGDFVTKADLDLGRLVYTPAADGNGANYSNFTFQVQDDGGTANSGVDLDPTPNTITLNVNAATDITNDALSTSEDTAVTANVLTGTNGATADNFESGSATITSVTQGANGSVTFLANGSVTYTPNADFNGSDSFTYTVTSGGVTETATVNVTVNAVADIVDDALTTNEDTAIIANVITGTNGASVDNFESGFATIIGVTQGAHGSVGSLFDGTIIYTPSNDFNGSDSFTYTVLSGGVTETATVNVTIIADADITNDALTTNEDTAITANVITGTNGATSDNFENVLAAVTGVTQGVNGSVTFAGDGNVTYTPNADFNGNDSFTYTVTSGGVTETATVNVIVLAVADITNDALTTNEDTPITANLITGTNGATADSFASGTAAITAVTQGVNGSVTFLADGTVTYTPNPDFNGSDSFTYTVISNVTVETAMVTVNVNAVADALDDALVTNEDTAIIANVLTGTNGATADTFATGTAVLTSVTQGAHGAVAFLPDGTVVYTPDADFNGSDSFTYTALSGGLTETANVNVTVVPVADATDDTLTTNEDTPITANLITGTNGATADTFAIGTAVLTGVTQGTNGSVTFTADGSVTYTPNADFNGSDSFTYTVTSGGVTETATVTVTVNAVADITDDTLVTDEDTGLIANVLQGTNGATADTFAGLATLTGVTQGTNGSVTFTADGSVTYTPNADFNGSDSFTYTVTSGGVTETATVNVTINAVADITDDALVTDEDTAVTADVIAGTNGAIADTFSSGAPVITAVTQGANGSVTFNAFGNVTYTPNADFNGSDSFTYTVTSGGVTETATVTVTVNAVADITDDALEVAANHVVTANVLTGTNGATADSFEDPGALVTAVTQGANGTVTFTADGSVTYTPHANFSGSDSFTYTVTSGGVTETATVDVTVFATDTLSISAPTITESNGDQIVTFTITSPVAVAGGFDLAISTTDGTADSSDYSLVTTTVHFAGTAGETQQVSVTVKGDTIVEGDENFDVVLGVVTGPSQAQIDAIVTGASATGTINNDDVSTLTISSPTVTEGDNGTTTLTFTVTSSQAVQGGFTAAFAVAGVTADASDYTVVTSSPLTFTGTAGETQTITVDVTGDLIVEANETFTATLGTVIPLGAASAADIVTGAVGTATITDNDTATVSIASNGDGAETTVPTNGSFTVTQSKVSSTDTVVTYTVTGTATAGTDYTTLTGTVTIPASQTSATINVAVLGDSLVESKETVIVTLTGFTGQDPDITLDATPANITATVNITDDDLPVFTSANSATVPENTLISTVALNVDVDATSIPAGNAVTYALSGPDAAKFNINPTTGEITFVASPDFEVPGDLDADNVYQVTVTATVDVVPSRSQTQDLTITVTSVNDNTPVFVNASPTFTLAENTAAGTAVGGVSATDADLPAQTLTYSIVSGNDSGAFAIDPATGAITVANAGPLNFEVTPTFTLTVRASDNTPTALTADAVVVVNLTDVFEGPTITNPAPTGTYHINKQPAFVVPDSSYNFDNNATPNYAGAQLTVSITAGRSKKDELSIFPKGDGAGQINIKGKKVFFGDDEIGTVKGGKGKKHPDLVVTFRAEATTDAVDNLIRRLNFHAKNEVGTTRTITVQLTGVEGLDSNVITRDIAVVD